MHPAAPGTLTGVIPAVIGIELAICASRMCAHARGRLRDWRKMTAADVRACLAVRWPDAEYLHIAEAPEQSDRGGRKLDLLVVSLWRSRGLELDGVEIKVSVSDWRRELAQAEKADFWWRHTHRFWIAVPVEIADTVKAELPSTWGLLACASDKPTKVIVKPPKRTPEPLSWSHSVGLMRAASDCGRNALYRAEARGIEIGRERGLREAERTSGDGYARDELEALRKRVADFEEASGLNISRAWDARSLGEIVAVIERERVHPGWLAGRLGVQADDVARHAASLSKVAAEMQRATKVITDCVESARKVGAA